MMSITKFLYRAPVCNIEQVICSKPSLHGLRSKPHEWK